MVNRREFMAAGAALAAFSTACRRSTYGVLDQIDTATLAAICDQIIPADHFPSASQAGGLTYIDLQLAVPYRRYQKAYREGPKQANELSKNRFGKDVTRASAQQQFEIVNVLEKDNKTFFELVRPHTIQGYCGSPRHGTRRTTAGRTTCAIRKRRSWATHWGPATKATRVCRSMAAAQRAPFCPMDTTFTNKGSRHNIHWVKCADCHEHGVPKLKTKAWLVAGD